MTIKYLEPHTKWRVSGEPRQSSTAEDVLYGFGTAYHHVYKVNDKGKPTVYRENHCGDENTAISSASEESVTELKND